MISTLGWDPSFKKPYQEHYCRLDALVPVVAGTPADSVLTDDMTITRGEFECTEFYNDWVRPQGLYGALAANILRENGRVGVALLSRNLTTFRRAIAKCSRPLHRTFTALSESTCA